MPRTTGIPAAATVSAIPTDRDIPTRVLVFGMVHEDGSLLAAELYPVGEACGQSPEQLRSCLRRLVAEGLLTREGEGRDARYQATDDGLATLAATFERTQLAFSQDAAVQGWDRAWRLVGFAVPETRRAARDSFRDSLVALGGAPIQPGLYVSPHPWLDQVTAYAAQLGVGGHVTTLTTEQLDLGGEHDPRRLAARLWPLDELGRSYADFTDAYRDVPLVLEQMRSQSQRLADADFLPAALVIGIRFQECFERDPLLPPELLPDPWPGKAARDLLATSRRLGVLLRDAHDRPRLFSQFDDLLSSLS